MVPLARGDVGECVLDLDALSKCLSAARRFLQATKVFLERFVFGNRNRVTASASRGSRSAFVALWAGSACLGIELGGAARFEWFHLSFGTSDCAGSEIDFEVALGEHSRTARASRPRLGEHLAVGLEQVANDGAVHVGAVDMQFDKLQSLRRNVIPDRDGTFLFQALQVLAGGMGDAFADERYRRLSTSKSTM